MKILYIGGTGNISISSVELALEQGIEVFLLNRGKSIIKNPPGAISLIADINNPKQVKSDLKGHTFDVVVNWIAFKPEDVQRDYELFKDIIKQYIFISSASAYQKPPLFPVITESTPLFNPYWDYSRDKIACEELCNKLYREKGFPVTIVRPSHTYRTVIPAAIGSWTDFTVIDRIRKGKPIVLHGDGTSLWTLTHSDDFARGFNGLLGHQQAIGHSFHITSDESLTWNQIYEAMGEAAGVEPKIVYLTSETICKMGDKHGMNWMWGNLLGDKSYSVIFDNTKIKTFVPEFKATILFKKGIKKTIDWFDEDPTRKFISEENNHFLDVLVKFSLKN
ncbi:MAG: SDR family oxidoreductase [Prolixibacteraceae bacterium]|nr:SDR family oxidoreductase [Prolixibacteraceae bacterium]MBN2774609.1 SDR family oxidoreductase [Prolixibacteraceae bacterium]